MKKNYIWSSIDNSKMKGDKPLMLKDTSPVEKLLKFSKIKKAKYVFKNSNKWNIPDNF